MSDESRLVRVASGQGFWGDDLEAPVRRALTEGVSEASALLHDPLVEETEVFPWPVLREDVIDEQLREENGERLHEARDQ